VKLVIDAWNYLDLQRMFKRPVLPDEDINGSAKRARVEDNALSVLSEKPQSTRTSSLPSPIMLLTGHEGEIYATRFSPDGTCFASAGYDMKIFLWSASGECKNFSTLTGHKGSVMDLHFSSDSEHLFTCATDKMLRAWDMETGHCLRKFCKTHTDFINSCHPSRRGPELIVSGGDDGCAIIHDMRKKDPALKLDNVKNYPITAVSFNDTGDQIIAGGVDNTIKVWDTRRSNEIVYHLLGHSDIITGISLSPDGKSLLSNAMDCTARIWDVQPFAASNQRCLKVFTGHQHNFEKNLLKCGWSPDGSKITCGSADRYTYIWNASSRAIMFKLPGHQGSVNAVDFHPTEPIIASAGSDKRIFLGELNY